MTWRDLSNDDHMGQGVHRALHQMPHLIGCDGSGVGYGRGVHSRSGRQFDGLVVWMQALADRLRFVRICCGDFARVLTPAVTTSHGLTGVVLDPTYDRKRRATRIYEVEDDTSAPRARAWAIENGDDPLLRIALMGLEGEHEMPESWTCVSWKTGGGYGNQAANGRGRENASLERMADGNDHEMSPALRAALEHRSRCQGINTGRMFAWHNWRLHIDSYGCMSSPERVEQTREFASIVRDVLEALGFWTGPCPPRTHSAPSNGYPWHAARWRLRARCFQNIEVRFYVDPHDTGSKGAGPYGEPERCADFFSASLFRKVKARISVLLEDRGFVDRSEHVLSGVDKVQFDQRTSGHWRDGLRITNPGRDDVDALKRLIVNGQVKAAYRYDGRLFVGTAYYGLNNMWRLVHGEAIAYVASHECFDPRPGLPHRFLEPRVRRHRVVRLLEQAVAAEDYERAAVLKKRARDASHGPTLVEMLKGLGG